MYKTRQIDRRAEHHGTVRKQQRSDSLTGVIVANEESGFGIVKCPGCGEAIPISEAIHHQIAERTRQEFKTESLEAKRKIAAKERQLDEKAAAFDKTISDRLTAERVSLSKEIEARLRSGLSTEIADLKRQADERSERLAKAQAVELELRTEKRNLEEREKTRDLGKRGAIFEGLIDDPPLLIQAPGSTPLPRRSPTIVLAVRHPR